MLLDCVEAAGSYKMGFQLSGSFRKLGGTLFWGPYNKDPTI